MLVTCSCLFWNQVTSKTKSVHRAAITDVKHQAKQVSPDWFLHRSLSHPQTQWRVSFQKGWQTDTSTLDRQVSAPRYGVAKLSKEIKWWTHEKQCRKVSEVRSFAPGPATKKERKKKESWLVSNAVLAHQPEFDTDTNGKYKNTDSQFKYFLAMLLQFLVMGLLLDNTCLTHDQSHKFGQSFLSTSSLQQMLNTSNICARYK